MSDRCRAFTASGLRCELSDGHQGPHRAGAWEWFGPPAPSPSVADLVHAELDKRASIGKERYGVPLAPHDGRDGLQDAIEECADQLFYLVKEREERKDLRARIAELETEVRRARARAEIAEAYVAELLGGAK